MFDTPVAVLLPPLDATAAFASLPASMSGACLLLLTYTTLDAPKLLPGDFSVSRWLV
jgi:hypothetical protein